jgi:bifunctional non-homologous end joining protein LigD
MALETYTQKRRFATTPEPPARLGKAHRQPIFVVQEHHASHLHYDFRLEADGVLKSWAIPKQPTLDPAVKRLAVRVEDHPLAYANFSGEIPAGQYGAGVVKIWDKGRYENLLAHKPQPQTITEGLAAGHLETRLYGRKLKGNFALIRLPRRGKQEHWLLVKMQDAEAQPDTAAQDHSAAATPQPSTHAPAAVSRPRRTSAIATLYSVNTVATPPAAVTFTHTDKMMFPEAGITKGDVLHFYERIAERLLPHLRDRPLTLERLPEGLTGPEAPHFWQKHTPAYYPAWLPRVALPSERGRTVQYALVNSTASLLYLVNQGTLTFHPWLSRLPDLDRPDVVLFDLDPGAAPFAAVVAIARQLHALLQGEQVPAFVKTSGKTGLHVLAPWQQAGGYDAAREWAMEMAQQLVAELPDTATVEQRKNRRQQKVYVDVLQNARGHHAVPPYVLRAVPAATVSTPLDWAELTPDLDPRRYNLKTIFRRLARHKDDPMAPLSAYYRVA